MKPTRKDLVLALLQRRKGTWVDGPELCDPLVGGSEGLRRVRELKAEGYPIEMRRHPNRARAVRQYQLVIPKGGSLVPPNVPSSPDLPIGYRWALVGPSRYELRHEKRDILKVIVYPGWREDVWLWAVGQPRSAGKHALGQGGQVSSLAQAKAAAWACFIEQTERRT